MNCLANRLTSISSSSSSKPASSDALSNSHLSLLESSLFNYIFLISYILKFPTSSCRVIMLNSFAFLWGREYFENFSHQTSDVKILPSDLNLFIMTMNLVVIAWIHSLSWWTTYSFSRAFHFWIASFEMFLYVKFAKYLYIICISAYRNSIVLIRAQATNKYLLGFSIFFMNLRSILLNPLLSLGTSLPQASGLIWIFGPSRIIFHDS